MRIAMSGPNIHDACSPIRSHIVESLRSVGHEVATCPGGDPAALAAMLERVGPDVLVNVPTPDAVPARDVREMTLDMGTVTVAVHLGLCGDGATDLRCVSDDLRHYDLVTVPDRFTFEDLRAEGTYRLALCEPAAHAPALAGSVHSERHGVVAVGDACDTNVDLVLALSDTGRAVTVMGRGWDALPLEATSIDPLPYPERGTLYAGAELVVELEMSERRCAATGRHWVEAPLGQVVLDAAVVATPSLTRNRPGVGATLVPEREVLTFASASDMPTVVALACADPERLGALGEAAQQRVMADHRWTQRWDDLFEPWLTRVDSDDGEDVTVRRVTQPA